MRPFDPRRIEVIDEATAAMYRAMTPAQRVAIACDAHETARAILRARVRSENPSWTEEQVSREVARRLMRESS
jgi:hypothetical protein